MAVCFGCGRHFGVHVIDRRFVRDEDGNLAQKRVVECPACGTRGQTVVDDGPTDKRYAVSAVRITTAAVALEAVARSSRERGGHGPT